VVRSWPDSSRIDTMNQKSKISFDATPARAAPPQVDQAAIALAEINTGLGLQTADPVPAFLEVGAVSGGIERAMPAPVSQSETQAQTKPLQEAPAFKALRPVQTIPHTGPRTAEPVPAAPGFAQTGLMAAPDPGFVQRNGVVLGVAAAVVLTVVLGFSAALVMFGGDDLAQQAVPVVTPSGNVIIAGSTERSSDDAPTRALTSDLTEVAKAYMPPEAPAGSDLAVAVLAGLRASTQGEAIITPENIETVTPVVSETPESAESAESAESVGAQMVRSLRASVLDGAYTVENVEQKGVMRVLLRATDANLVENLSVDDFTTQSAAQSAVSHDALKTPEGGIDVETMLLSLVQTSLREDGDADSAAAARDLSRRVFAASTARTDEVGGQRFYTVQAGDSLAYIALQFFGTADAYSRILDANPDTLQSSEPIQLGQRLIIPG